MGHTLTAILIILVTFHFKWNRWSKLAQAWELPGQCSESSESDHRISYCHSPELTDAISDVRVADVKNLDDKNFLLKKEIDVHPDKRLFLDIKHDFDIFIEFHESRTETTKLSLLLTAEDAGDNRVNSLPVHLDYTVASLELEHVISLQLSQQRVPSSQTEEIWDLATLQTTVFTLVVICLIFLRRRCQKITHAEVNLSSASSCMSGVGSLEVSSAQVTEAQDEIKFESSEVTATMGDFIGTTNINTEHTGYITSSQGACLIDDITNKVPPHHWPTSGCTTKCLAVGTKCRLSTRDVSILFFAALLLLILTVAVSKLHMKPTLHITFPATNTFRKVRMFSDYPELSQLSKDHSSLSLVSRLQLLDAHRCKDDFKSCQISVVCDSSTHQSMNCRCRTGYYFKDWQCHACTSTCPDNHYLSSSCNIQSNAVCKACTSCGPTQYEAAPCTTQRDTICIDVSFPVGILPMNKSYLSDDGIYISVSHSSNIFMERLINMEALETPMYITNNQQSLDFVWPRLSGLDIAVSISGVFLVPDYHDVDAAEDDTALFQKLIEPSQRMKENYQIVQNYYCRHPVPDYYSIQLEIIGNRTSSAQLVRCDSKDESVPRCPQNYKDGDRYLQWNINTPCAHMNTQKLEPLKGGPNSILCTEETDILRKIFQASHPTTQEYKFPSRDCDISRQECDKCLSKAVCPVETGNATDDAFLHDNLCCGIRCYTQNHCTKYYSFTCPQPTVECAKGEVDIFSLFPHFDSMERQFSCHLKYVPPSNLYSLSYTIRAPSINFNTTPQHFTVSATSKGDHEKRLSSFDFINAVHDTRLKVQEDIILIGDHSELLHYGDSLMKPFTVREIKSPNEMRRHKTFSSSNIPKQAFIQFEKPFLYSSLSWHRDGCNKNISRIFPNQTIYKDDFIPVMARKNIVEAPSSIRHPGYSYQMYQRDRAPYIKFYVEKGKSILQYLQGTSVKGKLIPNSLYGRVSWHHESSTWKLVFSGLQENCPTVISLKIFTQLMTGCAGHFDILINCPAGFSVEFNFSTNKSDLPDIFVVQVNDSVTTHNLVLSSVYTPVIVDDVKTDGELSVQEGKSDDLLKHNYKIWLPLSFIVIISLLLLLAVCLAYNCINKKAPAFYNQDSSNPEPETQTLNNHGEKSAESVLTSHVKPGKNCFVKLFIILYIVYCIVFSFTLTFGLVYYIHHSTWSNFSSPEYLGKQLLTQVNKSLADIQTYEDKERVRLFEAFQDRRKACIYHLESENKRLLHDYETATKKQVAAMFLENGTIYSLSNYILKQNVSAYLSQINEFITDCNKTIHSIIDRFQANYFLFLRNVALNDWLQVPRQIFLYQDGEDINRKYLSSTQIKQFATWLGIDKSEELLAVGENVFGRLASIPRPQIADLNINFPSIDPHLLNIEPNFDYDSHTHIYTVLEPSSAVDQSVNNLTHGREKRDADEFNLSGNLKVNPDNQHFSTNKAKTNAGGHSRRKSHMKNYEGYYNEKAQKSVTPDYFERKKTDKYPKVKLETSVVNIHEADDNKDLKAFTDQTIEDKKITESEKPQSDSDTDDSKLLYILIGIFITLDIVLGAYRFSWLSDQLYATRHGYVDRIPTDDACKHVLEIQTAYHLPAFENPLDESSGYYVDNKEQLYTEKEPELTFLQDFPKSKDNDILQKIWNKKKNKTDEVEVQMRRCFLVRWCYKVKKFFQRSFMSPFAWQGSVTFLAVIFLCIFIYCMNFWLTEEHFRSLVGGQSAVADVHWHLETSSQHLHGLASQLTNELKQIKEMCDMEIATLTDMFFATVNMQSNMFTKTLQKLCQEAKKENCEELNIVQFHGGRIVGCNFLPLQAQTFQDLSLSLIETFIAEEVRPIVQLSRWMLTIVTSLIAALLCGRLLCHAAASTIRHFMLLSNRLPRIRVYQSEDSHMRGGAAMHHSQSWVDSCESGVYLGETDEANKEENS